LIDGEPVTVDHDRIRREIDEEVRRRRDAGDLPAGFEQGLHDEFARRAPRGAIEADLGDLLRDVDEQSFFDTMAPVASARPGGSTVKRTLRTALGFYMRHVTTQMGAFAHATGRVLRTLADRLEAVEQQVGAVGVPAAVRALLEEMTNDLEEQWSALIDRELNRAPGPVLHVQGDDVVDRLGRMADASLGAVVLGSDVEHRPQGWKLRLVSQVGRKAAGDAVVVVLACAPDAWPAGGSPVVADLAPGRPFHAETWLWLLAREGFTDASVEHRDEPRASYAVVARRSPRA
jgi:hypothetical protein